MFDTVFDFRSRKNWKQAVVFYLFFFLAASLFAGIYAMVAFPPTPNWKDAMQLAATDPVLRLMRISISAVLVGLLLWKKNLYTHAGYILLGLFAVALTILTGTLLGLIPVAWLTTRPPGHNGVVA